jgi:dTDP-4-amino-4,6-dideoxygalactose transaminase
MTPAFLGGTPAFDPPLPFARPTIEDPDVVLDRLDGVFAGGMLTDGPLVRELEERIAEAFEVRHCVAVSSATVGLMLVLQAVDPQGTVLLPSFTFSATAHAARWNGADIAFADCDPDTWTLRAGDVYGAPSVVVGVHVSGLPADVVALQELANEQRLFLVFDAAHGSGSRVTIGAKSRPVGGFGLAEVFSLTPTKVMSSAEGGLVTTNDASLADHLRVARNYGNPGDYDTRFVGLNARLSELHAALALESLDHLEDRVEYRNEVATRYHEVLGGIPGVGFQHVPSWARSSYKDFTILLDEEAFGASRDSVATALGADGVQTRKYYSPPVHRQKAYADVVSPELPVTDRLAAQVISLPIWSHLPLEEVDRVGEVFAAIQEHATEVQEDFESADS